MVTHYRRTLRAVAIIVPLLLVGGAVGTRAAISLVHPHATVQVTIQNFAFSPQTLTIAPGTTVTWTQKDTAPHTVTSDTGTLLSSPTLTPGQTYSHTFTAAGTYTYHCAVHPTMTATIIVAGHGTSSSTGPTGMVKGMGTMGPMSMTSMRTWTGYYDDHRVLYLSTDTSNKEEALRDHMNYAPSLAMSLALSSKIYLVTNGAYAARGPAFGSVPGASDYTPLWREVLVTWKNPQQAVFLGSDNTIDALAKAGKLTLTMTTTVLNCPIIKVQ